MDFNYCKNCDGLALKDKEMCWACNAYEKRTLGKCISCCKPTEKWFLTCDKYKTTFKFIGKNSKGEAIFDHTFKCRNGVKIDLGRTYKISKPMYENLKQAFPERACQECRLNEVSVHNKCYECRKPKPKPKVIKKAKNMFW